MQEETADDPIETIEERIVPDPIVEEITPELDITDLKETIPEFSDPEIIQKLKRS